MKEKEAFRMHFRLAQLRSRLYQALEEGDTHQVQALSAQLDRIQLEQWQQQSKKTS